MSDRNFPAQMPASVWSRIAENFIFGSSLLSLLGWTLALTQQLRPLPYAIGLALSAALFVWTRRLLLGERAFGKPHRGFVRELHRVRFRIRKPTFVAYAVILLAAIVGGSLYLPSNYDALSYRTPQLLHWLDRGGWHWIETPNSRMNIASPGFNWLTAPFVILLKTDRLSFLANVASFALLPGFFFETLWRAGVSRRVAWWWMWLLPSAYVFAMQAGGIGNDLTGTVYALAAITFALRARESGQFRDAALSLIAVALCTGMKNTNLPVLLPWAVALGSGWRSFAAAPLKILAITLVALIASCLPTTVLNLVHTGHWTGDPRDEHRVRQPNPWVGATSNAAVLAVANLQPPLWPKAQRTNETIARIIETSWLRDISRQSPRFEAKWFEMPSEESASLGLGLLVLIGISAAAAPFFRRAAASPGRGRPRRWDVGLASLAALLAPVCLLSSEGIPRLIAPLVPSTLLLFLLPAANGRLVRHPAWRTGAILAAFFPIPALVLSPLRPLFPQRLIFDQRVDPEANVTTLDRARRVYSIYANRPDAFAPLRRFFPKDTRIIELIAFGDEPETSLWRPFGFTSVRHIMAVSDLRSQGIVVASDAICRRRFGLSAPEFAAVHGLTVSGSAEIFLRASGGPEIWYVLTPNE